MTQKSLPKIIGIIVGITAVVLLLIIGVFVAILGREQYAAKNEVKTAAQTARLSGDFYDQNISCSNDSLAVVCTASYRIKTTISKEEVTQKVRDDLQSDGYDFTAPKAGEYYEAVNATQRAAINQVLVLDPKDPTPSPAIYEVRIRFVKYTS